MSKKEKPLKLAPGKYSYKGYTIKSYGSHRTTTGIVWKAMNSLTEQIEHTGASLHEVVGLINGSN